MRGPIEQLEFDAQRMMARESKLPIEGSELLEPLGVKLGEPVEGAPVAGAGVLRYVELPEGWQIKPRDDHDMWSELLDNKGRKRARIFLKLNPYDRRGTVYLEDD